MHKGRHVHCTIVQYMYAFNMYAFNVRYRLPKVVSPTEHCKANVLLRDVLCSFHGFRPDANPRPLDFKSSALTTTPHSPTI